MKNLILSAKAIVFVVALSLNSGCAPLPSIVSSGELRTPSQAAPVVLARDVEILRGGTRSGLRRGTYMPEFEDSTGTYYRGAPGSVYSITKDGRQSLADGGLWISRNLPTTYWLYAYMGSRVDATPGSSTSNQDPTEAVSATIGNTIVNTPSAAPGQAAIAGALGGAFIGYLDATTRGSIMKHSELPEREVSASLQATVDRR